MSVVERLAERWGKDLPSSYSAGPFYLEEDARWWLRAIADEIQKAGDGRWGPEWFSVDEWLRAQADEQEE